MTLVERALTVFEAVAIVAALAIPLAMAPAMLHRPRPATAAPQPSRPPAAVSQSDLPASPATVPGR